MVHLSFTPRRRKVYFVNLSFVSAALMVVKGSAVLLVLNGLLIAQSEQRAFASPEDASRALFAAVRTDDQAAMLDIFGPVGKELIPMGDAVEDRDTREQFVAKYREMHRLAQEPDGAVTLYVGSENWALPVPLVDETGAWHFDTEAGKEEILLRRIGDNEYAVIEVCHAFVEAQNDYYSQSRDGNLQQYTEALGSPISPLAASSGSAGYGMRPDEEKAPYHGYYFRMLTGRGRTASSVARSYPVNGQFTDFAILAYPAEYRSSGVMTFIVDQSGDVYQKDLGTKTKEAAMAMTEYDRDETWEIAD